MRPDLPTGFPLHSQATSFPRWKPPGTSSAAATTADPTLSHQTVFNWEGSTDSPSCSCAHNVDDESTRSIVETVVRVTTSDGESIDEYAELQQKQSVGGRTSPDYVVAYHTTLKVEGVVRRPSCGDAGSAGARQVTRNKKTSWPIPANENSASSPEVEARELVVNFTSDDAEPQLHQGQDQIDCSTTARRVGNSSSSANRSTEEWRFPAWRDAAAALRSRGSIGIGVGVSVGWTNSSNEAPAGMQMPDTRMPPPYQGPESFSHAATTTEPPPPPPPPPSPPPPPPRPFIQRQSQPPQQPRQPQQQTTKVQQKLGCCACRFLPLRILVLFLYYVISWAATAAFTWGLLELVLLVTSRGAYPYYLGPNSFCLQGLQIGFGGVSATPRQVAAFNDLAALRGAITGELLAMNKSTAGDDTARQNCHLDEAVADAEVLARPCNLDKFVQKFDEQARLLLAGRPVVLVQIRRRIGYLPAQESGVRIECTAKTGSGGDLPVTHYSWVNGDVAEDASVGHVESDYFPLLSKRHNAPAVMVALGSEAPSNPEAAAAWIDKKITVSCKASEFQHGAAIAERVMLLQVKSAT